MPATLADRLTRRRRLALLCLLLYVGCMLPMSQAKQKFCGRTLNEAMDLLCVNGYNIKLSSSTQKRIAWTPAAAAKLTDNELGTEAADAKQLPFAISYPLSPFLDRMLGSVLASTRHRRDGGVYDECCRQPCTYTELAAYCRSA